MKRFLFVSGILLPVLLLTGCSIRFVSSANQDGGFFRSADYGEQWEQKVFVRQEKKKVLTISALDVSGIFFAPNNPNAMVILSREHGVYTTENGGEQWNPTALASGSFPAFAFDPTNAGIRYTATGRTIFKSVAAGEHWRVIYTDTRNEAITALAVDPVRPETLYAGTSSGTVLQSNNGGTEWAVSTNAHDGIRSLHVRPSAPGMVYLVTNNNGVQRTTDAGAHWEPLRDLQRFGGANQMFQLLLSPHNDAVLYAATGYGLLTSTDAGDTWTGIRTLLPERTVSIRTVAVDPKDPQRLYFTAENILHTSDNGGATWKTLATIPTSRLIARMVTHPTESGILYAGVVKVK